VKDARELYFQTPLKVSRSLKKIEATFGFAKKKIPICMVHDVSLKSLPVDFL